MDQVTPSILRERAQNYTYSSYMQSVYLIQNGVFVMAAFALINILNQQSLWTMVHLGALWIAAFFLSIVPLLTWTRGALLTNSDFRLGDSIFPYIFGMAEYGLFIFLTPTLGLYSGQTADTDLSRVPKFWYFAVAAHAWSAVGLITTRIRAGGLETFHPSLRELGIAYMGWMKRDRCRAGAAATLLTGIWVGSLFHSNRAWWVYIDYSAAILLVAIAMGICVGAQAEYREIRRLTFST